MPEIDFNLEGKRNLLVSVGSATLFFSAWWLYIDTAAKYGTEEWNNVYVIITIFSTLAMFMVNSVSDEQIQGDSLEEGVCGPRGAQLWLMVGFCLSFAALVASIWVMFGDYVVPQSDSFSVWPGVSLFLHNFLIFLASLAYKFGRTGEGDGYNSLI